MLLTGGVAAALSCAAAMADDSNQPVTDETLRLVALRTIFRGMQVAIAQGKKIDSSWPEKPSAGELYFPDALAGESVYTVVGKAMNKAENWASGDVVTGRLSTGREVRLRLFRWPNESDAGLLAILQYKFPDASPPMSCPSLGLLVHLVRGAESWEVKGQYLLDTVHHYSLQGIRLLDLAGRGADHLVVESNSGGAGEAGSSLQIFDLGRGNFEEVLSTQSRLQYMQEDCYMQVLDISRTRERHGLQFCVTKTTCVPDGKVPGPPRVTRPCYRRGEGVEADDSKEMLAPSR
jgi:hypothetical protein